MYCHDMAYHYSLVNKNVFFNGFSMEYPTLFPVFSFAPPHTTDAPASYASDAAIAIFSGVTGISNFAGSVNTPFKAAVTTTLSDMVSNDEKIISFKSLNLQYFF